jgi:1,4-dihydroxy-2-naphthoyl-CoA hydrolase
VNGFVNEWERKMAIWKRVIDMDTLNARGKGTLSDFLGIEFFEMGEDYLLARMIVGERHRQPMGIMHGGASCVLAETVGSTAANFCVDGNDYCVGLDINTNHVRSIREGEVIAKCHAYHLGRTTQVWGIDIKTTDGKLISVNRLTMAVLQTQTRT